MKTTIVCFVCTVLAIAGCAQDVIKPFGNLAWTNGFAEVVEKLSAIEGIESVSFTSGRGLVPVAVKGETNAVRLGEVILPTLVQENVFYFDTRRRDDAYTKNLLHYWIDADKKRHTYPPVKFELTAKPVIIQGVPFTLVASFSLSQGCGLKHPGKAMRLKGFEYEIPLLLTEVTLSSKSLVLKDNHRAISEILKAKYERFIRTDSLGNPQSKITTEDGLKGAEGITDNAGNEFAASGGERSYSIYYRGEGELKLLEGQYKKHLADIEGATLKGKKDLKSDL